MVNRNEWNKGIRRISRNTNPIPLIFNLWLNDTSEKNHSKPAPRIEFLCACREGGRLTTTFSRPSHIFLIFSSEPPINSRHSLFQKIFLSAKVGRLKKTLFEGRGFCGDSGEKIRRTWLGREIVVVSLPPLVQFSVQNSPLLIRVKPRNINQIRQKFKQKKLHFILFLRRASPGNEFYLEICIFSNDSRFFFAVRAIFLAMFKSE